MMQRKKNRIRFWQMLILGLIIVLFFNLKADAKSISLNQKIGISDYSVAAECGLNGTVKENKIAPVQIKIVSKKSDMKGMLSIMFVEADSQKNMTFQQKVFLKKGQKKTVNFELNAGVMYNYYIIQLQDESGKIRYCNQYTVTSRIDKQVILLGILSDSYKKLNCFDKLDIDAKNGIETRTMLIKQELFPKTEQALDQLDILLIADYDMKQLTMNQIQLLRKWVKKGGKLIVEAVKNTKELQELLKQPDISFQEENNQELGLKGYADNKLKQAYVLPEGKGYEPLSVFSKNVVTAKKIENGTICLVGLQLGSEKMQGWSLKNDFCTVLIREVNGQKNLLSQNTFFGEEWYNMSNMLSFYHGNKPPNIIWYSILLLLYIVIIGPVLYHVLKRKDKREYIWFLIPVAAFAFMSLILISSLGNRMQRTVSTSLTVIDDADKERAIVASSIQMPDSRQNKVHYKKQVHAIYSVDNEQSSNWQTPSAIINFQSKGMEYSVKNVKNFGKSYNSYKVDRNDKSDNFVCNIKADVSGVSGTIKNVSAYDLQDVIVCYCGYYLKIPNLKRQETYQLTGRSQMKLIDSNVYQGYFTNGNMTSGYKKTKFEKQDALKIEDYIYEQYILPNTNAEVYIFGIAKDYKEKYVSDDTVECNKAVIMTRCESDITKRGNYIVDIYNWYMMDTSCEWHVGKDNLYYGFTEGYSMYDIGTDKADMLLLSEPVDESELKMSMYNFQTEQYVDVFENGTTVLDQESLKPFIENGEFKIQFVSVKGNVEEGKGKGVRIPRIDLITEK